MIELSPLTTWLLLGGVGALASGGVGALASGGTWAFLRVWLRKGDTE